MKNTEEDDVFNSELLHVDDDSLDDVSGGTIQRISPQQYFVCVECGAKYYDFKPNYCLHCKCWKFNVVG